jgi:hypothetical protein
MKLDGFTIIIDTREQKPLVFEDSERGTLHTGDYSVKGFEESFVVEHKTIKDLIGTCDNYGKKGKKSNRTRFKEELQRMKDGFSFYCIAISGLPADIDAECKKIYTIQWRQYKAKQRRGYKGRPPMRPEVRALGVKGSLNAFRVDYNAHYYFLGDKTGAATWIQEQSAYFMRDKTKKKAQD